MLARRLVNALVSCGLDLVALVELFLGLGVSLGFDFPAPNRGFPGFLFDMILPGKYSPKLN